LPYFIIGPNLPSSSNSSDMCRAIGPVVFCSWHLIAEVLVQIPGYSILDRLGESGVSSSSSFRHPVTAIAFSLASSPQGTSVTLWHGCRDFLFLFL